MLFEVAIPAPVPGTFTYSAEDGIAPGSRVVVPFGPRKLVGVVVGASEKAPAAGIVVKKVTQLVDSEPVFSAVLIEIAAWMSRYYFHPIGEVFATMLPGGAKGKVSVTYELTAKGDKKFSDENDGDGAALRELFHKKRSLRVETLRARIKKLTEAGQWREPMLHEFVKAGLIKTKKGRDVTTRKVQKNKFYDEDVAREAEEKKTLTPAQSEVFEAIFVSSVEESRPQLLWGLTGSGKTEIYLQSLARVFADDAGAQALVLVPEISLTPQMTRVFDARFPGQVAVVHSALSDTQRWAELERIRSGRARVLIGPRSAVFGPFKSLRLVVVDEEHDPSYKQGTGLPYNGRDIAILRAKMEKARVILGSATPSLESYQNAQSGKYQLLKLTERVSGRPLPVIRVIEADARGKAMSGVQQHAGGANDKAQIAIHADILDALRDNQAQGRQSIVIVNRRGYAYYLFSLDKKKAVSCPHCSISLTVHGRLALLRCHYCDYQVPMRKILADNPDERFVSIGYGSQQAEDYLKEALPEARIVRIDSDTTNEKDMLPRTLEEFGRGEIDILVGTQILAKGHDFPNVTLIAILEVDQTLNLPDFRAGERTFQLVVQAAGRAGRDKHPGRVLIQTLRPDHPVIMAGAAQDFPAFAATELAFRKLAGYPPFTRMVLVELNSEHPARLNDYVATLEAWLEGYLAHKPDLARRVHVLGPAVPPIEVIRKRHRRTILFSSPDIPAIWTVVRDLATHFPTPPGDIRMRLDADPQTLV